MYKLLNTLIIELDGSVKYIVKSVLRINDNSIIPFCDGNKDYAEYLQWIEEGNEPLPPDDPTI